MVAVPEDLAGMCDCLADERFSIAAIGLALAIVGVGIALAAVIAGGPFVGALSIGALLTVGAAAIVAIGTVDTWCTSVFNPWYAQNFG